MIPDELRRLVEKQRGHIHRNDCTKVERALSELGISRDSEFAQFFLEYVITFFPSSVSDEELCDIAEPTFQIRAGTTFAHEVWELPERYVCFTTCEGEGGYLYDKESGAVFDFSLATRDAFVEGREPPRWRSFFEFMRWYLGDE
jgi:hypothetical protein